MYFYNLFRISLNYNKVSQRFICNQLTRKRRFVRPKYLNKSSKTAEMYQIKESRGSEEEVFVGKGNPVKSNKSKSSVNKRMNTEQGHWILAKMGKKVLRPGGKELTLKLIRNLNISSHDAIVEFAPGMGYTASLTLAKNPKSYTGIELNEEAAANLQKTINGDSRKIIVSSAANSTLKSNSVDKVYGEAMLTMQIDARKSEIIREAHRILKSGGLYGIHELGLTPNDLPEKKKAALQRELAMEIKVNARPLTVKEWSALLEKEGFRILSVETNDMLLLEKQRMIEDEGFYRALKIGFNILTHPKERKRLMAMRATFRKNQEHLNAVAIVAEKV